MMFEVMAMPRLLRAFVCSYVLCLNARAFIEYS